MIPEAAVEAAARAYHAASLTPMEDDGEASYAFPIRAALEAAAPHMLASGKPMLHAYAAAGFTACGLETGGAISRHDGYDGPPHRTTADDKRVTCEGCIRG